MSTYPCPDKLALGKVNLHQPVSDMTISQQLWYDQEPHEISQNTKQFFFTVIEHISDISGKVELTPISSLNVL